MGSTEFRELIDAMPAIASAVNAFKNESVQVEAFRSLVAAYGAAAGPSVSETSTGSGSADAGGHEADQGRNGRGKATGVKKAPSKGGNRATSKVAAPPLDGSLDLHPKGKKSFEDFAAEKNPSNFTERSMVAVYWLKNELQSEAVTISRVFTCYKRMGWRTPNNPVNQLQVVASTKKYLDTSSMENIQLTHAGSQYVEFDLPKTTKA
jgi:hypothetical protein